MPFVFGYGSLVCPGSVSKTLKRPICRSELCCVTLQGYQRSWTAQASVRMRFKDEIRAYQARFLDLKRAPGCACNGVAIEVSEQELAYLDVREQGYERHCVELLTIEGEVLDAYAYMIPVPNKCDQGVVLARYIEMIETALKTGYPAPFAEDFWRGTAACPAEIIEGEYIFADCVQNLACGRSLE